MNLRYALTVALILLTSSAFAGIDCPDVSEITLRVVILKNERALKERYRKVTGKHDQEDRHGFATYNKRTDVHTLYVTSIRNERDRKSLSVWGHELAHAICGAWHE